LKAKASAVALLGYGATRNAETCFLKEGNRGIEGVGECAAAHPLPSEAAEAEYLRAKSSKEKAAQT
jgi:hypothetical protein